MKLVGDKDVGFSNSIHNIINRLRQHNINIICEDHYNPRRRWLIITDINNGTYTKGLLDGNENESQLESKIDRYTLAILKGMYIIISLTKEK